MQIVAPSASDAPLAIWANTAWLGDTGSAATMRETAARGKERTARGRSVWCTTSSLVA
jgi:hypothetical protein